MPSGPVAPSGNTANNSTFPRSNALAGAVHRARRTLALASASKPSRVTAVFIESSPLPLCPADTCPPVVAAISPARTIGASIENQRKRWTGALFRVGCARQALHLNAQRRLGRDATMMERDRLEEGTFLHDKTLNGQVRQWGDLRQAGMMRFDATPSTGSELMPSIHRSGVGACGT